MKFLNLSGCKNLSQLLDLSRASKLEKLDLSNCSSINKFPLLPNQCNINYVRMSGTKIEEVPASIECLTHVTILCLDSCDRLKTLPTTICKLKSLRSLSLAWSSLQHFPEILEPMECLKHLVLDGTAIEELHPSIENLIGLNTLRLRRCQNLRKLPNTIVNMRSLDLVDIQHCCELKCLPKLPFSIRHLAAYDCESLERFSNPWILVSEAPCVDQTFDFSNCSKLKPTDIVTEFQSRIFARNTVPVSPEPKGSKVTVPFFIF